MRKHLRLCEFKEALASPLAPWGTSPVGSPRNRGHTPCVSPIPGPPPLGGLRGDANASLKSEIAIRIHYY